MNRTDELSEQQERDDLDARTLDRGRRMTGEDVPAMTGSKVARRLAAAVKEEAAADTLEGESLFPTAYGFLTAKIGFAANQFPALLDWLIDECERIEAKNGSRQCKT